MDCVACQFEAEYGTKDCPRPVDPRVHTCIVTMLTSRQRSTAPALVNALGWVARMARVAWACREVGVLEESLAKLTAVESLAGVSYSTPRPEDLVRVVKSAMPEKDGVVIPFPRKP